MNGTKIVVRVNGENLNHHLWNNHGVWWVHYTLHLPDWTKQRVRQSLGTSDLDEARRRRDECFRQKGVNGEGGTNDVLPLAA